MCEYEQTPLVCLLVDINVMAGKSHLFAPHLQMFRDSETLEVHVALRFHVTLRRLVSLGSCSCKTVCFSFPSFHCYINIILTRRTGTDTVGFEMGYSS